MVSLSPAQDRRTAHGHHFRQEHHYLAERAGRRGLAVLGAVEHAVERRQLQPGPGRDRRRRLPADSPGERAHRRHPGAAKRLQRPLDPVQPEKRRRVLGRRVFLRPGTVPEPQCADRPDPLLVGRLVLRSVGKAVAVGSRSAVPRAAGAMGPRLRHLRYAESQGRPQSPAGEVAEGGGRGQGGRPPEPQRPRNPEDIRIGQHRPANCYNGMLLPLEPFAIRGAIWYQGESNAGRAYQYRSLFPPDDQELARRLAAGRFPLLLRPARQFHGGQAASRPKAPGPSSAKRKP